MKRFTASIAVPLLAPLLASVAGAADLARTPYSSDPIRTSDPATRDDPILKSPLPRDPAPVECDFNPNVYANSTYQVSFRWESYDREWVDGPIASVSFGDWHAHPHDVRFPTDTEASVDDLFRGASILWEGESCPSGWDYSAECDLHCKDEYCDPISDFKNDLFCGVASCPLECRTGGLPVCQRKFVGQSFEVYGGGYTLTSGAPADLVRVHGVNGPYVDELGRYAWRRADLGSTSNVQEPYVEVMKTVTVDESCGVEPDTWYRFRWRNSWRHLDGARRLYHANHAFEWDVCLSAGMNGVERVYAPDDHFDLCTTQGCGQGEFHVSAVRYCRFVCVGGDCPDAAPPPPEDEPEPEPGPEPVPGHCLCEDGTITAACLAPDDDAGCDHGCSAGGHYGGACEPGL